MEITYHISSFEGPLDLLLTLIQKNKFDIFDIPIAEICGQYMDFINEEALRNPDISSDFLVMASRLMLIKSRMLLPRSPEEDEEDPRAELAAAVAEYARAKEASELLAGMYSAFSGRMIKDTDEIAPDKTLIDQDPERLASALYKILDEERLGRESVNKFTPIIKRRAVSAEKKADEIMSYLKKAKHVFAYDILRHERDRSDMIAAFLAILELLRSEKIIIEDGDDDETGVLRTEELTLRLAESEYETNDTKE